MPLTCELIHIPKISDNQDLMSVNFNLIGCSKTWSRRLDRLNRPRVTTKQHASEKVDSFYFVYAHYIDRCHACLLACLFAPHPELLKSLGTGDFPFYYWELIFAHIGMLNSAIAPSTNTPIKYFPVYNPSLPYLRKTTKSRGENQALTAGSR